MLKKDISSRYRKHIIQITRGYIQSKESIRQYRTENHLDTMNDTDLRKHIKSRIKKAHCSGSTSDLIKLKLREKEIECLIYVDAMCEKIEAFYGEDAGNMFKDYFVSKVTLDEISKEYRVAVKTVYNRLDTYCTYLNRIGMIKMDSR